MKNKVLNLVAAVGLFALAAGLMSGSVQEVIAFADPLNEMVMCVAALGMGIISLVGVFAKPVNK